VTDQTSPTTDGDIAAAIIAVQEGLERKTTILLWTLRAVFALLAAVLAVAALALIQSRDNHTLADRTNQTLHIVKDAVDPNSAVGRRGQQAAASAVAAVIRCVNNHTDVVILHAPKDPSCP
jgi:hypothetical protein